MYQLGFSGKKSEHFRKTDVKRKHESDIHDIQHNYMSKIFTKQYLSTQIFSDQRRGDTKAISRKHSKTIQPQYLKKHLFQVNLQGFFLPESKRHESDIHKIQLNDLSAILKIIYYTLICLFFFSRQIRILVTRKRHPKTQQDDIPATY